MGLYPAGHSVHSGVPGTVEGLPQGGARPVHRRTSLPADTYEGAKPLERAPPIRMVASAGGSRAVGGSLESAPLGLASSQGGPPAGGRQAPPAYHLPTSVPAASSDSDDTASGHSQGGSGDMRPPPPRKGIRQSLGGAALRVPLRWAAPTRCLLRGLESVLCPLCPPGDILIQYRCQTVRQSIA